MYEYIYILYILSVSPHIYIHILTHARIYEVEGLMPPHEQSIDPLLKIYLQLIIQIC